MQSAASFEWMLITLDQIGRCKGNRTLRSHMYSSTFTFAKGEFDAAFFSMDAEIAQIAKSIPGYLGEEAWENTTNGLVSNVYYWESMEALQKLVKHPAHLAAKLRQGQWLQGYQVVIAQVVRSYGDGKIEHPLHMHRSDDSS